ncbi:hypothetical protein BDA99DRAFT_523302 [Phascolomyces articulosus]|uniref:Protein kinase domain-containing protein n=1 Tax=Phascolomyces articulosus TaxID=60185 RepID=A0AAD5P9K0_9FUNG|nr:hypothetical protein BDA99DRAFT_523302 [Phascolomyces articulosus]
MASNNSNILMDERQEPSAGDEVDWPLGSQRIHISLVVLRLCTFVLDELMSCYSVFPFVSPVPATAFLYHAEIKQAMDFSTLQQNLYHEKYKTYGEFEQDLQLIWLNAKRFHNSFAVIYRLAVNLEERYEFLCARLRGDEGIPKPIPDPVTVPAPEETRLDSSLYNEAIYTNESVLYFLQLVLPTEKTNKAIRGFSKVRGLYDQLNEPFLRVVESMRNGELLQHRPLPRLYIGKNRTLLAEARNNPHGIVAIMMNVKTQPYPHSSRRDLCHLTADIVLAQPIGECQEFDTTGTDATLPTDYLPKASIKLKVIKVQMGVQAIITESMERLYFRRAYTTHRLSTYMWVDVKKFRDLEIAKLFVKAVVHCQQDLEEESRYTASNQPTIPGKRPAPHAAVAKKRSKHQTPSAATSTTPAIKSATSTTTTTTTMTSKTNETLLPSPQAEEVSADRNSNLPLARGNTVVATPASSSDDKKGGIISFTRYLGPDDNVTSQITSDNGKSRDYYLRKSKELWEKVFSYCKEKHVPLINVKKYLSNTSAFPNAEGYFKHVYYVHGNNDVVVQTFRRMTITQRATELVSLLALHNQPSMGQIIEVLQEDGGEIIGLTMKRYQKTLKQYTHKHTHHRLTAHQKMDLIRQMLVCMKCIHELGIAHRDLSEVNFMVDESKTDVLEDGSVKAKLYLIDFGKALLTKPDDMRRWWVDRPKVEGEYEGEVLPENEEDLETWCKNLPWVKAKPDHGYRHYRSIQTLPRGRTDHDILPWLIHPIAEDIYSIGTLIWKIFSETEPWYGILDTDLKGLRETVKNDFSIEKTLEREVVGKLSRELLRQCLRTSPEDRKSAAEILGWLDHPDVYEGLVKEWTENAPVGRTKRHAKAVYKFEEEQSKEQRQRRPTNSSSKKGLTRDIRGRARQSREENEHLPDEESKNSDEAPDEQDNQQRRTPRIILIP